MQLRHGWPSSLLAWLLKLLPLWLRPCCSVWNEARANWRLLALRVLPSLLALAAAAAVARSLIASWNGHCASIGATGDGPTGEEKWSDDEGEENPEGEQAEAPAGRVKVRLRHCLAPFV